MSKVTKIETALRCLLVCSIFASPLLPAQAQQVQTSGPQETLTQASAPLFTQPNFVGDLRQHSFFAGDYRNAIQTGVGFNDQPLFFYDNPVIQTIQPGPTPISTGLIGDNIDITVQNSVPGLVNAAVTGAVLGTSALTGAAASTVAAPTASAASVASGTTGATVTGSTAPGQAVTGTALDGTQF